MKNTIWRIVLAFAVLFGALASINSPAHAEETASVVYCDGGPCEIIDTERMKSLEENANFWMYLTYGQYNYKVNGVWYTYGFEPEEIRIDRNSYTSIPQMGIYWWKDRLVYSQVGWSYDSDVPLTNPSAEQVLTTEELADIPTLVTYSWDGSKTLTWNVNVSVEGETVVILVNQFMVQFMKPINSLPAYEKQEYDLPANFDWIPGEELQVSDVHINSRTVPEFYQDSFRDLEWYFDEELAALVASGLSEEESWNILEEKYKDDPEVQSMLEPWYNYRNTLWSVTWEWVDGYSFKRPGGSVVNIKDEDIMANRACLPDENCYSTSFNPKAGETVFVYPYTLWNKDNLWLFDVYPGRKILPEDEDLLNQRIALGQVIKTEGVVDGIVELDRDNDGGRESRVIGLDNDLFINLTIHYMPPIGAKVFIYTYIVPDVAEYGNYGGEVMALFDEWGKLWYFNNDGEKGHSFDAETYGVTCGGLMNISLWTEGCTP